MKKIEEKMNAALAAGREFKQSNTQVIITSAGHKFVMLYSTLIYADIHGRRYYSDGGCSTVTTASRLRALGAAYSTNPDKCRVKLVNQDKMIKLYWSR